MVEDTIEENKKNKASFPRTLLFIAFGIFIALIVSFVLENEPFE